MHFKHLSTPTLLLDKARLQANADRMLAKAQSVGVALRPHMKTAKSAAVAAVATDNRRYGITVSTLREARYFADHGFDDITYAVGIVPSKLDQAAQLAAQGVKLKVITDSVDVAHAIAAYDAALEVLVEVDCGDHRAGVQADSEELIAIGAALRGAPRSKTSSKTSAKSSAKPRARLGGVLTHAGHSYGVNSVQEVEHIAQQERDAVVGAANRLREAGHEINTVSAGSSPTALHIKDASGLSELRAGVYVFFDLDQQSRGVCAREDIALSVLASVIGHNRAAGKILLDSGGLALSKDVGANAFRPEVGYGEVCNATTLEPFSGLYVSSVSQEHGHIAVADEAMYARLPVGSKVRVLPNHACMTAAAYECYHVLAGTEVVDAWDRVNGW